ncbi:MAG: TolC family protein [Pseudomonadota bacterium]
MPSSRNRAASALFLAFLLAASSVNSQTLTLADVRASTQQHVPAILRAIAANRVAAGERDAANGAFDLVFAGDSYNRLGGFWDGRVQTFKATKPVSDYGASIYSQYRLSEGNFPIYEDEFFTNTGGQFKLGVLFSLLRDRDIDARRFALADAEFSLRASEFELMLVRIGLAQEATIAYWRWAAAGQRLAIYRRLLTNALDRNVGLEREVREGARAAIFLTENQQNINRRRALVVRAERDLALAANVLSFYWRDSDGDMRTPVAGQLPMMLQQVLPTAEPETAAEVNARLESVLARHPELGVLRNAIDRSRVRIALRENSLMPRLDGYVEFAHGVGAIAEGGRSRDSTDTVVGLNFSVPIARREARARLTQERDRLSALEFQALEAADRIEQALVAFGFQRFYARELYDLATQEVAQLQTLQNAERQRFAAGASDFFLVNVREENAANSEISLLNARLDAVIADVNFEAATLDFEALDLEL